MSSNVYLDVLEDLEKLVEEENDKTHQKIMDGDIPLQDVWEEAEDTE